MTPPADPPDNAGDPEDAAQARRDALRLLAYRARSQTEVRRRLERRYPTEVATRVVAWLLEHGYLDDEAFAREWRRQREQHRPRSQAALRRELLREGVDPEVVREALEGFDDVDNAYRAARTLARRLEGSDRSAARRRLQAHLQRRGFSLQVIAEVAQRLLGDLPDPLDGDVDPESQEE